MQMYGLDVRQPALESYIHDRSERKTVLEQGNYIPLLDPYAWYKLPLSLGARRVCLQNVIADERYAARGFQTDQNMRLKLSCVSPYHQ